MKIRTLMGLFICSVFLGGCILFYRYPDQSPTLVATANSKPTVNIISSITTVVPHMTSVTPSKMTMLTATYTPTEPSATIVQKKCLEVLPKLPKDKTYKGKLISLGQLVFPKGERPYYAQVPFLDLKTGQTQFFSQYKISNVVVSPDRTKYALQDRSDPKIKVFSSEGRLLTSLPPGQDPWFLGGWLDNERLVLAITKPVEGTMGYVVYPQDMVIANPFTGEQQRFSSTYPEIDKWQLTMMWDGGGITKYEPTLTRVVYASTIQHDYIGNSDQGYVLWDLVHQRKVVEIATGDFGLTPKWSPDGSEFIINNFYSGEFFTITRDGIVSQLTHLNSGSGANRIYKSYFSDIYSWSPDGRYLAFWLESVKNQTVIGTFSTLDMSTGVVTDYCVSSGNGGSSALPEMYAPVWSPDGKYVAVIANRHGEGDYDELLLDLEGGFAVKISGNFFPVGWVDSVEK